MALLPDRETFNESQKRHMDQLFFFFLEEIFCLHKAPISWRPGTGNLMPLSFALLTITKVTNTFIYIKYAL